jgi:lipopolysaccharide export system permease protein
VVNLRTYSANFGSVSRNRDGSLELGEIVLFERPKAGVVVITTAQSGQYRDGVWTLRKVFVSRLESTNLVVAQSEDDMVINERISIESIFASPLDQERTAPELAKTIMERKSAGFDTTSLEIKYHTRFSVPAACVVFALVAPVFAVWFARGGGFMGVLLSIFLVFLYFNGYVISTEILGRNGIVSPWLAAWLPNMAFMVLGALGIRRLE